MHKQPSFFIGSTFGGHGQVSDIGSEGIRAPPITPVGKIPPLKLRSENSTLNDVGKGLFFDEEVVRERCFHLLPYDDKYFWKAVDPSDVVRLPKPIRVQGPMGRHNKSGITTRHMPCIRKARSKKSVESVVHQRLRPAPSFLTEIRPEIHYAPKKVHSLHKGQSRWDEYLLSILSKNTANWIVSHNIDSEDPKKQKFGELVHEWHGSDLGSELIRDSASDVDGDSEVPETDQLAEKGEWRKRKEQTLLEKVRYETKSDLPTDPYSEENAASFYRLPAGMRRTQKSKQKEDGGYGSVNKLAARIDIVRRPAPPPPSLRDHLPAGVGDKILDTDNEFEQEMLTGTRQTYQSDQDKIIMESDNKYRKQLQTGYPRKPESWNRTPRLADPTELESEPSDEGPIRRGFRRWRALPSLIDESANVVGSQAELEEMEFNRAHDPASKRRTMNNSSLLKILEEWRGKWFLNSRFADATTDDLLRDMADCDTSIRLKAVLTLSRAMEFTPHDDAIQLAGPVRVEDRVPAPLLKGLVILLHDEMDRVRTAVAITLFALKIPTDEAEKILREKVQGPNPVDKWAAVQCLAHHGICDHKVVGALIDQLMTSEDAVRHEQATHLLAQLSSDVEKSSLVYSMLAEHLNSTNWRHKVISCKTLPVLGGSISKDIANKLTHLMWFDWHKEVRKAAAQCLGRTGHGKDVHDDLIRRLEDPAEKIRADAVSRLGYLGIMTAKLLPIFLKRFDDEHVLIREETCIACGNLALQADEVIEQLVEHASYDPIWRVKALAIQSLGKTGILNPAVRHCLLWALRYETEAAVRAESCQSIIKLGLTDDETADILQDRYLVETSPIVQLVIIEALAMYGISPIEDMNTVARVKQEVRKLCAKHNISSQITLNEKHEEREENVARFLCQDNAKLITEGQPVEPAERISPTQTDRPSTKPERVPPEGELEAIPEDDESYYQSRPVTTSSLFSFLSEDSDLSEGSSSPTRSSRKSSGKSRKSSRTKSGKRLSRVAERREGSKEESKNRYQIQEPTPIGTPVRSIRGSIFGALSRTALTPAAKKRTPLKFHYIMENIDSFDGMDLSDVIGTLTLNKTVGDLPAKKSELRLGRKTGPARPVSVEVQPVVMETPEPLPQTSDTDPKLGESDQKLGESDPKLGESDPKLGESDQKLGESDQKLGESDQKLGESDSKLGESDPKLGEPDPKLGESDSKLGESDPKLGESESVPAKTDPSPESAPQPSESSDNPDPVDPSSDISEQAPTSGSESQPSLPSQSASHEDSENAKVIEEVTKSPSTEATPIEVPEN